MLAWRDDASAKGPERPEVIPLVEGLASQLDGPQPGRDDRGRTRLGGRGVADGERRGGDRGERGDPDELCPTFHGVSLALSCLGAGRSYVSTSGSMRGQSGISCGA